MKHLAGKVSHLFLTGALVIAGCSGSKGDLGPKGDTGDAGLAGKQGAPGPAGSAGPAGKDGAPGAPGDAGTNGSNGSNGTNGKDGATGASGDAGPQGAPGATGAPGAPGATGATGASGKNGANGDAGADGASTAPLTLTITNSLTGAKISGATITLSPSGTLATTDANGATSGTLPIGTYSLSIAAAGYTTATQAVSLVADVQATVAVKLVPTANLAAKVTADVTAAQAPGATVNLTASSTIYDGSTNPTYTWKQLSGPTATITPASSTSKASVTIPTDAAILTALQAALASQVDPTPPARLDVIGINPYALGIATTVVVQVTSTTTTSGSKTEATTNTVSIPISPTTPFTETSGLRNVPIGVPQLLQAGPLPTGTGAPTAYSWSVAPVDGSTLVNPATQFPIFTPKPAGNIQTTYTLTEAATGGKLTLYAGTWSAGALDKTNVNPSDVPQPKAPAAVCALCHKDNGLAPNVWSEWSQTGHSVIVPENIDATGSHWTFAACGSCHSVGYNTTGIGGSNDWYQAILAKEPNWQIPMGAIGSYYSMLTSTDATAGTEIKAFAGLLNVQCENCHGPNESDAHQLTADGLARRNLKADVCGQCHGEPLRHGRYQEWQRSKHANLTVAIGRAVTAPVDASKNPLPPPTSTSCGTTCTGTGCLSCQATWANPITNGNTCTRCHTGEGYVLWQDQSTARSMDFNWNIQNPAGTGDASLADVVLTYGLTQDKVHSQTCATCHDPHDVGMTSGLPNTTNVRGFNPDPTTGLIPDIALLPSGFPTTGLGKGGLCATCHNSRNGVHNDTATYIAPGAQVSLGSVHDSTAAEVLLGQNVYFVTPGQRGGHSFIEDTCVNCHMRLSAPPSDLSNTPSTNHTFAASLSICTNCHGAFDGGSIQTATKASLTNLLNFVGKGIQQNFANIGAGKGVTSDTVIWVQARRNLTDTTAAYSHASGVNTALANAPSNAFKDLTPYNISIDLAANPITGSDHGGEQHHVPSDADQPDHDRVGQ